MKKIFYFVFFSVLMVGLLSVSASASDDIVILNNNEMTKISIDSEEFITFNTPSILFSLVQAEYGDYVPASFDNLSYSVNSQVYKQNAFLYSYIGTFLSDRNEKFLLFEVEKAVERYSDRKLNDVFFTLISQDHFIGQDANSVYSIFNKLYLAGLPQSQYFYNFSDYEGLISEEPDIFIIIRPFYSGNGPLWNSYNFFIDADIVSQFRVNTNLIYVDNDLTIGVSDSEYIPNFFINNWEASFNSLSSKYNQIIFEYSNLNNIYNQLQTQYNVLLNDYNSIVNENFASVLAITQDELDTLTNNLNQENWFNGGVRGIFYGFTSTLNSLFDRVTVGGFSLGSLIASIVLVGIILLVLKFIV